MALKLFKTPSASENYTIDLTNVLGDDILLSVIITYAIPNSITINNVQINSSLLNNSIFPGKAIQMDISGGQNGYEYTIIVRYKTVTGITNDASVVLCVLEQIPLALDYYGSVYLGDTYFNNILNSDVWVASTNPLKRRALVNATLIIDRYNYDGEKTDVRNKL